jgi:hypothetical protein
MTTPIVSGALEVTPTIVDDTRGVVLTATDTRTNNSTKGNPGRVADIFGDWREEMLYRTAVAWQPVGYNQPAYLSFYFASDMDWANVPLPERGR